MWGWKLTWQSWFEAGVSSAMSEPDDALPSAPPAEEVLSPLEYAELYSMASCAEADVEQGLKRTKKALKLQAYAKRLKLAVQQRVEKEVNDARSQRWIWKSSGANALDLEKQLQDLQRLIDDVSSVSSAEDGVWRYKKVWEPKLEFIQEDVDRGVPEDVIASKYDIYDAAGEAIQYQQSMKLLREIGEELKQTESILTETEAENESESLRLLSFFDILQGRIDSAKKLEAKASKLNLQANDCETAIESMRSAVSGLEACLDNSAAEGAQQSHRLFLAEAQESAARLSQHAKEARKDFEMIQKSNREATEFLNSQLLAYGEAQRSCGLLSGTLKDLQQAMLEHKEEPPLPSVLEPKRELLSNMRVWLQRCIFKARAIEAFEMEERLKRCQTEADLATTLDLARRIKGVDPVLVEEKEQLLTRLTEKRIELERRKETFDRRMCVFLREAALTLVLMSVTVGTVAGIQMNIRWLRHPPPLDSKEDWVDYCKVELGLTGVLVCLVVVLPLASLDTALDRRCLLACGVCFLIFASAFPAGLLPALNLWSSDAPDGLSWVRVLSICVFFAFFSLVWLCGICAVVSMKQTNVVVTIVLVILLFAAAIACLVLHIWMPVWSVLIPGPMLILSCAMVAPEPDS